MLYWPSQGHHCSNTSHARDYPQPPSPTTSAGYTFVEPACSSTPPAVPSSPGFSESRASIAASLEPCPQEYLVTAHRLVGASTSGSERVKRAWLGGQWALAVAEQRVPSPNRLPPLDLRNRFHAVLFAEDLSKPTIFQSASSYFRCVGDLRSSSTISHAFPSEHEAMVVMKREAGVLLAVPVGFLVYAVNGGCWKPGRSRIALLALRLFSRNLVWFWMEEVWFQPEPR